jgi:FtsZ-interacting cell division protein ZipA
MVTVVVLTVAGAVVPLVVVVVGLVTVVEVVAVVEAVAVDVVLVDGWENRARRNSVHESRYSTASPSETSSMDGDTV